MNKIITLFLAINLQIIIDFCFNIRKGMIKCWEDLKDTTFVSMKLTKAKSFTEGFQKAKKIKLSQTNPVYEHIVSSEIKARKKRKQLQTQLVDSKIFIQSPKHTNEKRQVFSARSNINLAYNLNNYESNNQVSPFKKLNQTQFILRSSGKSRYISQSARKASANQKSIFMYSKSTEKKEVFLNKIDRFKTTVGKFQQSIKKSHQKYDTFITLHQKLDQYFQQFPKSPNKKEEMLNKKELFKIISESQYEKLNPLTNFQIQRLKILSHIKKEVKFPLSIRKIKEIIEENQRKQQNVNMKAKTIITSLYQYKSNAMKNQHKQTIMQNYGK